MSRVEIYDATLREGAFREGVAFSIEDRLKILGKLDELGIHYVDGGLVGGRGKEDEFFQRAAARPRGRAQIVAQGGLGPPGLPIEKDPGVRALLDTPVPVVAVSRPIWDRAVTGQGDRPPAENQAAIGQAVGFLAGQSRRVFLAADHAFDGFRENPAYALACLRAAADGGVERIILSDTNGGSLPGQIAAVIERVRGELDVPVGVHTRNDADLAVAGALAGVAAGATLVQGTVNGYGDRCGGANLVSILANLQLKLGIPIVSEDELARLSEVAHFVSELANLVPDNHQPFVGLSAFVHRAAPGGAVARRGDLTLHHIEPALVGNYRRLLVSDLAGRSRAVYRPPAGGPADRGGRAGGSIAAALAGESLQFSGAEASLELLLRRAHPLYRPPFELVDYLVIIEKRRRGSGNGGSGGDDLLAEATVKVRVAGELMHTVAEGNGPVNALDQALRKALKQFYPALASTRLLDYKVRVLDETEGTAAVVRVLLESTDGERRWTTVGTHGNIIEASWRALEDSIEYWLTSGGGGE